MDVPCPQTARGNLLIQSASSLISAGTERSLVEFSRANLISKARQQPERVKQVLDKIKSDGLLPTLEAVFTLLDQPLPLGYCNAGTVLEVGPDVEGVEVGQRVASNGPHAELVHVPKHLCAPIPEAVSDDHAAFAVLGSIGLQGIRLLSPTIGEAVAVYGLGLVGLMTVQMLVAAGVRVLGIDLDPSRLELARRFGAVPANGASDRATASAAEHFSGGNGIDGVLITASAKNDNIVHQAAQMSRKRGRIVLVGVVDLELQRADFYEKELSFQVSCSYGPGRYDANYEQQGQDYPYSYVRWTEQRNIESVLAMMATGKLGVEPLISSRVPHGEAVRAYEALTSDRTQLGIVLQYPQATHARERVVDVVRRDAVSDESGQVTAGIIGAGRFTQHVLLPELKRLGVRMVNIASAGGVSATHAARKFGVESSSTDHHAVLQNPDINTVFITTRHHLHAPMIIETLDAGKHVFVEKPVAIDRESLDQVRQSYERHQGLQFLVGFNRRFAPLAVKMRELLSNRAGPVCATALINAGNIPADNWNLDSRVGGGRIIGEACHWIDLLRFLIESPIDRVHSSTIGQDTGSGPQNNHVAISLNFRDGSLANIQYFANGPRTFPKERLEIFCDQRALQLDNFRFLRGFGWDSFQRIKKFSQDKGHRAEFSRFVDRVKSGGQPVISADEIWNVSVASIAAQESATRGKSIDLN